MRRLLPQAANKKYLKKQLTNQTDCGILLPFRKQKLSVSHRKAPAKAVHTCFVCVYSCADSVAIRVFLLTMDLEVFCISKQELMINEEIRDREVRLIGDDGAQLGVMSSRDALALAIEKNLDLVKIAPKAEPPVCKIMDYGKYKFETAKREKEARKNQKIVNIKEIRFSPSIDDNDLNTKAKNASKFLKEGDKVKVTVRFRGREVAHAKLGEELLIRFGEMLSEVGTTEKRPKLEGRNMTMMISPINPK